MKLNYDTNKINSALQDFYNATGINIRLLDKEFSAISYRINADNVYCKCIKGTPNGIKSCTASDRILFEKCRKSKKPEIHICHAGLVDIAIPLLYNDEVLGYTILGQIKKDTDFSDVEEYVTSLGLNPNEAKKLYNSLNPYDSDKIQSIQNIALMLTKYLLLENCLKPYSNQNIELAVEYINDNLEKPLSIQSISKNINLSKSALYKYFHNHFGCTVNGYINTRRIEKSLKLLEETDLSIEQISQKIGFSSCAYYTRIFKKEKGITPLKFRKKYFQK